MSDIGYLAREVATRLEAILEPRLPTYYLTVTVQEEEGNPHGRGGGQELRSQLVSLDLTQDERHILVGSTIGDYHRGMNLEDMLRRIGKAIYARLYINDDFKLALEAGVATEDLDGKRLAKVVREMARLGDEFEEHYVGGDAG
jgi:hypothetical protein